MFALAEFLFDFPFKNFILFYLSGRCFGNCSKRIVQLSWLSLCISPSKEQKDHSNERTEYLSVNGKKEYVKFSRINCFASLGDHTQFAILMNADPKQDLNKQVN